MIVNFLRGYSWEPSPVFDMYVSDPAVALRASGGVTVETDGVTAAARAALEQHLVAPGGARRPRLEEPSVAPGVRAAVAHLRRYQAALWAREQDGEPEFAPRDLYWVDGTEHALRELVGFRLRGHPMALFGACIFPRHRRSAAPDGRPSLASYLSRPPRAIGYAVDPLPPGRTHLFLPAARESIPAFVERLREHGGAPVELDASVIDVAFDLRFGNPSEIRQHSFRGARSERSVFRTIAGHVVSGVSVGLSQTLHKDDRFVTLTDAVQHRPDGDVRLPTLAVNRSILALQAQLPEGQADLGVRATLAFHPSTASRGHLLGAPYDDA